MQWVRRVPMVFAVGLGVFGGLDAEAAAAPDETKLISRADGAAGAKANGSFVDAPAISADGRYIVFSSNAQNLDGAITAESIFIRDTLTDTTKLVSRASGVSGVPGNDQSSNPTISADGRYVAYASTATNLDPAADNDPGSDVYLRDTVSNTTELISRQDGAAGPRGGFGSTAPSISADGSVIAFESLATNFDVADIWRAPATSTSAIGGPMTRSSSAARPPASAMGIAMVGWLRTALRSIRRSPAMEISSHTRQRRPTSPPSTPARAMTSTYEIFVADHEVDQPRDRPRWGQGRRPIDRPSISGDGDRVAFTSLATNLDAIDTSGRHQRICSLRRRRPNAAGQPSTDTG